MFTPSVSSSLTTLTDTCSDPGSLPQGLCTCYFLCLECSSHHSASGSHFSILATQLLSLSKVEPLPVTFPWTCHVQGHFHLPHAPRLCGLVPNWISRLQNSPPWLESFRDFLLPSASHSGLFTIWTLLTSPTSSPGAPSYVNKVFPKVPRSS